MFICRLSNTVSKPREKPVMVVLEERPITYVFLDSDGETISTFGKEIVKEVAARQVAVDPAKAARIEASKRPLDTKLWEAQATARYGHAAKCKKPLDDCHVCQQNIAFFNTIPLPALSRISEERRVR